VGGPGADHPLCYHTSSLGSELQRHGRRAAVSAAAFRRTTVPVRVAGPDVLAGD
jgi:hypothetical protein